MRRLLLGAFLLVSLVPVALLLSAADAARKTDGWGDWAVWGSMLPLVFFSSAVLTLAGALMAWMRRGDRAAARVLGLAALVAAAPSVGIFLYAFASRL